MNSDSNNKRPVHHNGTSGFTLVEALVALAITGIFMAGVITAFVQIIRASNRSQVTILASTSASTALELMALDIKTARIDRTRPLQIFLSKFQQLPYGNGIDDDSDGTIDEEIINGADEDGDFTDNHALIAGVRERTDFVGSADLGDIGVDEDCKFRQDKLSFVHFSNPLDPNSRDEIITFSIGTFQGEEHVLLKERIRIIGDTVVVEEEPVAFEVLSLAFLFWDLNDDPPYWKLMWDASLAFSFNPPGIELPAAVFISVTVYSGTEPFEDVMAFFVPGTTEIETATMQTVVAIEQVLDDPRYPRRR